MKFLLGRATWPGQVAVLQWYEWMAQDFSKRSIATLAVVMTMATGLTIWSTWFVLHAYVLERPDPLYRAGGLKPSQRP